MYIEYPVSPKINRTQKSPLTSTDALIENSWKPKVNKFGFNTFCDSFRPGPNRLILILA